jgi:hypothetical protein
MIAICNVRGDGNCYYRCIWNCVKGHALFRTQIGLGDCKSEECAVRELRACVANHLRRSNKARRHLLEVWKMAQDVDDLEEEYPIVADVRSITSFSRVLLMTYHKIATTNIMASALEHAIVQDLLPDLQIAILTRVSGASATSLIRQAQKCIERIMKPRTIILINEDNIHYKYVKVCGETICITRDLCRFTQRVCT